MSGVIVVPSEFLSAPVEMPCHIDGLLLKNSLIGIIAESGAGKTFLTLGMALSMAARIPWFGREVDAQGLLYVCGEGFPGIPGRVLAWCDEHNVSPDRLDQRIGFCRVPFDISDGEMFERILAELATAGINADVVIIDTISSNAPPGFNENDTANMKAYMDAARRLRDALPCTVIFVHHIGKSGLQERGSSDFRGSMDVILQVKGDGDVRTLSPSKLRDLEPFAPIPFLLKPINKSAVAVPTARPNVTLQPSHRQALSVLAEFGLGDPVKATDWLRKTGTSSTTFYRILSDLLQAGYVQKARDGYVLTPAAEDLANGAEPTSAEHRSVRHSRGTPTNSRGTPTTLLPLRGESGSNHESGREQSHGTPTGLPREQGPGMEEFHWGELAGAAK